MCFCPAIGFSRPCDLIYLKDWFYWFTELMWCQFNQCAMELCRIWHLCELRWIECTILICFPQYLFSYLSKSWLIQCVQNNGGTCCMKFYSMFVCLFLFICICIVSNSVCCAQISSFYCNSGVYNLHFFSCVNAMLLPHIMNGTHASSAQVR